MRCAPTTRCCSNRRPFILWQYRPFVDVKDQSSASNTFSYVAGSRRMAHAFELAEGHGDTYQTLLVEDNKPKVVDKTRKRRRFFWWLRWGQGKPEGLESYERRFGWRKDFQKPFKMLCYPHGPGSCDHNAVDRSINLATTLPFFGLAWHSYRNRKTDEGKLWGASLAGVGLGSLAFHSTSGDARPWGRKIDYWAIALSSIALMRTLYPKSRGSATAVALAVTPFNPLAVSSANAVAMETKFWRQARKSPALKDKHSWHLATVGAGTACFAAEELYPHWPIIHAAWHCLSFASIASTNYLVADLEAEQARRKAQI